MRRLYLLLSFMVCSACMGGSDFETSHPATSQSTEVSISDTELLPGPTPTWDNLSTERHLTLPSGLRIDEYVLQDSPELEPLTFVPLRGSQQEILSQHEEERSLTYLNNSFFADGKYSMSVDFGGQELVAREVITSNDNGLAQLTIEVMLGDIVIHSIPAGDVSPLIPLQGLWTFDGHWIVEVASVSQTHDEMDNENVFQTLGLIIKDSEDLNQNYAYHETFGFQLLNGKPFYFFSRGGEIGFSYNNKETRLGYELVPHYGCCSAAVLNPKPAENIVSFFTQKNGYWFYVEIGVFE